VCGSDNEQLVAIEGGDPEGCSIRKTTMGRREEAGRRKSLRIRERDVFTTLERISKGRTLWKTMKTGSRLDV